MENLQIEVNAKRLFSLERQANRAIAFTGFSETLDEDLIVDDLKDEIENESKINRDWDCDLMIFQYNIEDLLTYIKTEITKLRECE